MLSREDNELLTRVGPGTPMGELMRRFWIPALLSWELPEPDCPPVRVRLLGEDLVAFRDTRRPGRPASTRSARTARASLFFGRNEEDGLRCVYHGWKFDVDGHCVDMPNEPETTQFKDKISITSYPTLELGDMIWAYLGPAALQPRPASLRLDAGAGDPSPGVQGDPGDQLAAGAGGRGGHLARAHPAPAHHDRLHAARVQAHEPVRASARRR